MSEKSLKYYKLFRKYTQISVMSNTSFYVTFVDARHSWIETQKALKIVKTPGKKEK